MPEPRWHIEHASLFDYLATLAADSVDACVTAEPFVRIARARIQHVVGGGPIAGSEEQLGLFDARETA